MAGPCSAESERQVMATATALRENGVKIFRAGIWKPRTHPGGFEGRGAEALPWLRRVKEELGLAVATEVACGQHVEQALQSGMDMLWIGARTTANPFAVQEIADSLRALGADVPVLVKNPVSPDLELWIGALERLNDAGISRLGAIHRGFSLYGEKLYRNSPIWQIPIELKLRLPQLPLIQDPSHTAGRRELVAQVAREGLRMGFDGLMVETHCNPQEALSDRQQQLTPAELADMLCEIPASCPPHSPLSRPTKTLEELRSEIDSLDDMIIELLGKRMETSRAIGELKHESGLSIIQPERFHSMLQQRVIKGREHSLGLEFISRLMKAIHEESVRQQL